MHRRVISMIPTLLIFIFRHRRYPKSQTIKLSLHCLITLTRPLSHSCVVFLLEMLCIKVETHKQGTKKITLLLLPLLMLYLYSYLSGLNLRKKKRTKIVKKCK